MWGSSLLISPVLDKNKRTVYAYFPRSRWFDFYTGKEIKETGRIHELDAPLEFLPLHIKGGSIIVTQEHAMNTDKRYILIMKQENKLMAISFQI
jgi:alpha-glucosidase (family GH31 glycosyl hydrolase)